MHAYRSEVVESITFRTETVPPQLQRAIALALDRHALNAKSRPGPRYTWQAVRPEYQTAGALAPARALAAPWLGTKLLIYDHARCERADVLAYQLGQIGLRGGCLRAIDPLLPDVTIGPRRSTTAERTSASSWPARPTAS